MRFQVISSGNRTLGAFKEKYDSKLAKYHIQYFTDDEVPYPYDKYVCLTDEETYMQEFFVFIEVETLDDVIKLKNELKESLIFRDWDEVEVLEIYDGYRE